jgi:hypothetical protein
MILPSPREKPHTQEGTPALPQDQAGQRRPRVTDPGLVQSARNCRSGGHLHKRLEYRRESAGSGHNRAGPRAVTPATGGHGQAGGRSDKRQDVGVFGGGGLAGRARNGEYLGQLKIVYGDHRGGVDAVQKLGLVRL